MHFSYELVDSDGNPIDNEEEFDKWVEKSKITDKYNL